jgi:hypothetical protein
MGEGVGAGGSAAKALLAVGKLVTRLATVDTEAVLLASILLLRGERRALGGGGCRGRVAGRHRRDRRRCRRYSSRAGQAIALLLVEEGQLSVNRDGLIEEACKGVERPANKSLLDPRGQGSVEGSHDCLLIPGGVQHKLPDLTDQGSNRAERFVAQTLESLVGLAAAVRVVKGIRERGREDRVVGHEGRRWIVNVGRCPVKSITTKQRDRIGHTGDIVTKLLRMSPKDKLELQQEAAAA